MIMNSFMIIATKPEWSERSVAMEEIHNGTK